MTVNPESHDMDYKERMTHRPTCDNCALEIRDHEDMEERQGLGDLFTDGEEADTKVVHKHCPDPFTVKTFSCPNCGGINDLGLSVRENEIYDGKLLHEGTRLCEECPCAISIRVRVIIRPGSITPETTTKVIE